MTPDQYVEAVLAVVERIPSGRVMSYGEIAAVVGLGGPRQVGRVLSLHGGGVPWWRVVTAAGRTPPGSERRALEHLRAEGTPLRDDHVDMGRAALSAGTYGRPPGSYGRSRSAFDPPPDWPREANAER